MFLELWKQSLSDYDELKGIQWDCQALDGAITKAPLGGKKNGRNPTDRGKLGVKRSLLVDGRSVPLGLAVDGANRHDSQLVRETLESLSIQRPRVSKRRHQTLCVDAGYVGAKVARIVESFGYKLSLRKRNDEAKALKNKTLTKALRRSVERAHSWMNRSRRILIRWEKKVENYLAFVHLTCALIDWNNCC